LLDEVGFDELRLDAVKHIEPGFMAPFLVEMAAGDQPFAVGELFDGDIGTLKGYSDQVEAFNTTFGIGSKDANLAIFDFNLRFAIRDFCNNTSGGYDMWNLNNAGLLFNGMPGEDIVNFVENHDFDRIGYVQTDCNDPDVVTQEGSTCLKFSIDSGHDPVIFDKHLGYAYITAAEGRPSIFWKDWFWFGLKEEIKWQLALRSEMASGSTTPIVSQSILHTR
jgi:alpha-amylase